MWLCWHFHALLERCGADDRVCHLQNRVAAYHYARAAATLPYPSGVRRQLLAWWQQRLAPAQTGLFRSCGQKSRWRSGVCLVRRVLDPLLRLT